MNSFTENIINGKVKRGYWKNIENRKVYADFLFRKMNFEVIEDWYKISLKDFDNNYGHTMIANYYGCSPIKFILDIYSDYKWIIWKFKIITKGYWMEFENHKTYANWLLTEQGYDKIEDWYKMTRNIVSNNYGSGLLEHYYQQSVIKFVKRIYPEYNWLEWKFISTPEGFWKNTNNVKKYTDWVFQKQGYNKMEDWYKLTRQNIVDNCGSGLLHHYNSSHIYLLKNVYKEYEWLDWKFNVVSGGYWNKIENCTKYIEWLFKELNYSKMEDWYNISKKIIINNYGLGLLLIYNSSPINLLKSIYPEYKWLGWKFKNTPLNFWRNIENQTQYFNWLFTKLGHKTMEDWYKITQNDIIRNDGNKTLCYKKTLKKMFPEFQWDMSKFKKAYSIGQIVWLNYLLKSTPDIVHALNNDDGEYKILNSRYKADGYSRLKNTIFEYHGDYYHGNPKIFNALAINEKCNVTFGELYDNTLKKQNFCLDNGYNYCFIWESDWIKAKLGLIKFQKIVKSKLPRIK
jgi:hypothetical protein